MASVDNDFIEMQGEAAIDAYDALKAGFECLSHFTDIADQCSQKQLMIMVAWVIAYQLSIESRFITKRLDDIIESIDCAGAKTNDFWMTSDIAAKDKANELGINVLPEYSWADLRYKIYCAIHEVH